MRYKVANTWTVMIAWVIILAISDLLHPSELSHTEYALKMILVFLVSCLLIEVEAGK